MMVEQKKLVSEIIAMLLKEGHSGAAYAVAGEYGISSDEFLVMEEDFCFWKKFWNGYTAV